jgi:hypothetical protein
VVVTGVNPSTAAFQRGTWTAEETWPIGLTTTLGSSMASGLTTMWILSAIAKGMLFQGSEVVSGRINAVQDKTS